MRIIDGKKLAEKIKDRIVKDIIRLNGGQLERVLARPNLAIILIGERDDSKLYVKLKEKEAKKLGLTRIYINVNKRLAKANFWKLLNV